MYSPKKGLVYSNSNKKMSQILQNELQLTSFVFSPKPFSNMLVLHLALYSCCSYRNAILIPQMSTQESRFITDKRVFSGTHSGSVGYKTLSCHSSANLKMGRVA